MSGRLIYFIIISIIIFTFNAKDFDNLNKGVSSYIQAESGFLDTILILMTVPQLGFDLKLKDGGAWVILILEAIYISIYTFFYLKIRKKQEEEINEIFEAIRKKRKFDSVIKEEESQNEKTKWKSDTIKG